MSPPIAVKENGQIIDQMRECRKPAIQRVEKRLL
jgi:hypothetical protein